MSALRWYLDVDQQDKTQVALAGVDGIFDLAVLRLKTLYNDD